MYAFSYLKKGINCKIFSKHEGSYLSPRFNVAGPMLKNFEFWFGYPLQVMMNLTHYKKAMVLNYNSMRYS